MVLALRAQTELHSCEKLRRRMRYAPTSCRRRKNSGELLLMSRYLERPERCADPGRDCRCPWSFEIEVVWPAETGSVAHQETAFGLRGPKPGGNVMPARTVPTGGDEYPKVPEDHVSGPEPCVEAHHTLQYLAVGVHKRLGTLQLDCRGGFVGLFFEFCRDHGRSSLSIVR